MPDRDAELWGEDNWMPTGIPQPLNGLCCSPFPGRFGTSSGSHRPSQPALPRAQTFCARLRHDAQLGHRSIITAGLHQALSH
jgi:hypothetical protein